jgi:hypothetical protein
MKPAPVTAYLDGLAALLALVLTVALLAAFLLRLVSCSPIPMD